MRVNSILHQPFSDELTSSFSGKNPFKIRNGISQYSCLTPRSFVLHGCGWGVMALEPRGVTQSSRTQPAVPSQPGGLFGAAQELPHNRSPQPRGP
jgi:hypothetical protein